MAKKQKTQEPQGTQEKQQKRTKAGAVDIAIQEAKNKANKTGRPEAVVFTDKGTGEKKIITIEMPDDPDALYLDEIDPNSPTYNPEKLERYKQQIKDGKGKRLQAYIDATEKLNSAVKKIFSVYERADLLEKLQRAADAIYTPEIKELAELLPYIKELAAGPEYKQYGSDLDTIIATIQAKGTYQDGSPVPGSDWEKLLNEARKLKEKAKITAIAKRTETLDFPLDKINSTVWSLLEKDTQGQIALRAEKAGSKDELSIFYSINFEALENVHISKRLTAFDKTVYIAAAALFNAGNEWITLTQIYYAMGNPRDRKPASHQLEKILNSVRKMKGADIFIDNKQEAAKYNYPVFKYEGDLLPTEKITAEINGKLTDAAIHLFREPPLITFARERNQITTVNIRLLAAPISKTENHLAIQDYLLERISRAKHGTKKQARILFNTLAEKTADKTGKKGRLQEAAEIYLKHFKAEKWITGYTTDKDGITIHL